MNKIPKYAVNNVLDNQQLQSDIINPSDSNIQSQYKKPVQQQLLNQQQSNSHHFCPIPSKQTTNVYQSEFKQKNKIKTPIKPKQKQLNNKQIDYDYEYIYFYENDNDNGNDNIGQGMNNKKKKKKNKNKKKKKGKNSEQEVNKDSLQLITQILNQHDREQLNKSQQLSTIIPPPQNNTYQLYQSSQQQQTFPSQSQRSSSSQNQSQSSPSSSHYQAYTHKAQLSLDNLKKKIKKHEMEIDYLQQWMNGRDLRENNNFIQNYDQNIQYYYNDYEYQIYGQNTQNEQYQQLEQFIQIEENEELNLMEKEKEIKLQIIEEQNQPFQENDESFNEQDQKEQNSNIRLIMTLISLNIRSEIQLRQNYNINFDRINLIMKFLDQFINQQIQQDQKNDQNYQFGINMNDELNNDIQLAKLSLLTLINYIKDQDAFSNMTLFEKQQFISILYRLTHLSISYYNIYYINLLNSNALYGLSLFIRGYIYLIPHKELQILIDVIKINIHNAQSSQFHFSQFRRTYESIHLLVEILAEEDKEIIHEFYNINLIPTLFQLSSQCRKYLWNCKQPKFLYEMSCSAIEDTRINQDIDKVKYFLNQKFGSVIFEWICCAGGNEDKDSMIKDSIEKIIDYHKRLKNMDNINNQSVQQLLDDIQSDIMDDDQIEFYLRFLFEEQIYHDNIHQEQKLRAQFEDNLEEEGFAEESDTLTFVADDGIKEKAKDMINELNSNNQEV